MEKLNPIGPCHNHAHCQSIPLVQYECWAQPNTEIIEWSFLTEYPFSAHRHLHYGISCGCLVARKLLLLLQVWKRVESEQLVAVNTFCWERKEVVRLPGCGEEGSQKAKRPHLEHVQTLHDGSQVGR